jgi:hypothetical protein
MIKYLFYLLVAKIKSSFGKKPDDRSKKYIY